MNGLSKEATASRCQTCPTHVAMLVRAKDMPNVQHMLSVLARAGDTWPRYRGDWGRGISQTERAISFRNAIRVLVTIFRCTAAHDLTDTFFGGVAPCAYPGGSTLTLWPSTIFSSIIFMRIEPNCWSSTGGVPNNRVVAFLSWSAVFTWPTAALLWKVYRARADAAVGSSPLRYKGPRS